jgi:thioredoxin-dependent peroxiredoxin
MPKAGDTAPAFDLPDQDGKPHKLSDYKGKWVVLFAYPKASTTGCTKEAIAFTSLVKKFEKQGAVVLGISPDKPAAQKKFEQKFGLKIPLLADEDKAVLTAYGCWGEKSLYGRKFMGVIRSTWLIDPKGKLADIWTKVKVDGHAEAVLETLATK